MAPDLTALRAMARAGTVVPMPNRGTIRPALQKAAILATDTRASIRPPPYFTVTVKIGV